MNYPARQAFPEPAAAPAPPPVSSLEDTGLSRDLLTSLLLKTLYQRAGATGFELVDAMALPFSIVDELLRDLQYDHLVEIREADGPTRTNHRFTLTSVGRERAMQELVANRYVGPAPVPLPQYVEWVERQSMSNVLIDRGRLEEALDGLVLADELLELVGPAVNSGKSMFLYGEPGNGKTRIAQAVADMFGEAFYVPHAVELDGLLMVLFDPVHHKPIDPASEVRSGPTIVRDVPQHDRRFVRVRRPVVTAGGELNLEHLDLRYDAFARTYQAPIHLKANGGIMFVDDLGRQRVSPRELLNRWIVPLEHRVDHLSLHNGKTITMPFDCLVVFATNIEPAELVEEAFLRRIHYKIHVPDPEPDQFDRIFSDCCNQLGLDFDPAAPELIRREYYATGHAQPRGCHPRDILGHLHDIARFQGLTPSLSPELLRRACDSVFVPVERPTTASQTPEVNEP